MNLPHANMCVLPWVSLETSPIGTVRPCCLAEQEITDDTGQKFHLTQHTLSDIQHSTYMRNLRQQFLRGERPDTCLKCWREEDAGRTSKRMHTLNRLRHIVPQQSWSEDAKPLLFLDLKLGNICNLKCRICGSWSSSTFAAEEVANLPRGQDRRASHHYQMMRQGAWPRESDHFWQELEHITPEIRYIEFTGGEPFMIAEHFDLLQRLVDQGRAGDIEIHYNTNGTIFPNRGIDIWPHFRVVEIAFSIDDVGERFEYQRSNARWSEVTDNIARFRELRNQHRNIQLQVCSTVNVFNVMYLEQLAQWNRAQGFDFVYWNMLHEAFYLSISTLPDSTKCQARERLRSAQVSLPDRQEFDKIESFMMNGDSLDGKFLRNKIRELDQRRGQNLAQVAPELAKAIDYDITV
jgi:MoaA/NifB/PqqE/SkfB family radical SAM enzyme